jgi:hypothetical protein
VLAAPYKNVYAEIGTTFASSVITFPTVCAHILGQLLKFMGEDRVVFGSDAVWYGSPQWQIEALWRFEIPEDIRQMYGYPRLTKAIKRKILGLNSARLYKIVPGVVRVAHGHDDDHDRDDHDHDRDRDAYSNGVYRPIPTDYEARITPELKRILEFPTATASASSPLIPPETQFDQYRNDKLAAIKESYEAQGGQRSNTRYGWLRTRA